MLQLVEELHNVEESAFELPHDPTAVRSTVMKHIKEGKRKQAIRAFNVLKSKGEVADKFWVRIGKMFQSEGEHNFALEAFGLAVLYEPGSPTPHMAAADSYIKLNRYDLAEKSNDLGLDCCVGNTKYASQRKEMLRLKLKIEKELLSQKKEEKKRVLYHRNSGGD